MTRLQTRAWLRRFAKKPKRGIDWNVVALGFVVTYIVVALIVRWVG